MVTLDTIYTELKELRQEVSKLRAEAEQPICTKEAIEHIKASRTTFYRLKRQGKIKAHKGIGGDKYFRSELSEVVRTS